MEKLCPLLKKACVEHQCRWYLQLLGKHPQTGQDISEWGCAVELLPILLIETSKEVRQAAAATESLRNENVSAAGSMIAALDRIRETAEQQNVFNALQHLHERQERLLK